MKKSGIINPFKRKTKVVVVGRAGIYPKMALRVLLQIDKEFNCDGEIPWQLAKRQFFINQYIKHTAEFVSLLKRLELQGYISIKESYDEKMRTTRVIKLK